MALTFQFSVPDDEAERLADKHDLGYGDIPDHIREHVRDTVFVGEDN